MSQPRRERSRVIAVFALLTLVWGTTWAAIRLSLAGIPPLTGVGARFALGGLVLLAFTRPLGVKLGGSRRERRLWLATTATTFIGSYSIVYWGEQWIPSGLAAALFATFTLFVGLWSHLLLPREPLSRQAGLGILIGFAGVGVIFSDDLLHLGSPEMARAGAIFLAAPFISALGAVIVKRWGEGIHPLSLAAVPMCLTGALLTPLGWWLEREQLGRAGLLSWLALIYLALIASALAFSLYYWLIARVNASEVALLGYTVPLVAVIVGGLVLGEDPSVRILAGASIVLLGVAVASRRG